MNEIMPKITFCIPSKNNLRYLKACIPSIRKNSYRNDHDIIVFVDKDTDGTVEWLNSVKEKYNLNYIKNPDMNHSLYGIGKAYDACIRHSKTDIFIIFHADMMLAKHADILMFNLLGPKKVVCATRVEPPLHPEGPEKIVRNFGLWPETDIIDGFKEQEFDNFIMSQTNSKKITHGCFAPWMMYREDFIKMGMHDPIMKSAREDSDVFNRFSLIGYEMIQSWQAYVYHLTCRGGQFEHGILTKEHSQKSQDWQQLMHYSTLEFIRKWGSPVLHDEFLLPIVKKKYDIAFVVDNCNISLIRALEPWCSRLDVGYGNNIADQMISNYIKEMQPHTKFNLSKKIYDKDITPTNDIILEFDGSRLTQQSFNFLINQLTDVITETNDIGQFEFDIFKITINKIESYEKKLITLDDNYYTNKLL